MKIIDVCPDCADRKWEAKWRATPHDSVKEDKGRQQRERRETKQSKFPLHLYPTLNKKKHIEQD